MIKQYKNLQECSGPVWNLLDDLFRDGGSKYTGRYTYDSIKPAVDAKIQMIEQLSLMQDFLKDKY